MGAQGTAIVDFGPFPGASEASVLISAPGIAANSLVEAWILPTTTADHSPDEHRVETLEVVADQSSIVPNVSFLVLITNTSQHDEEANNLGSQGSQIGGIGTFIYGKWQVGWVWN